MSRSSIAITIYHNPACSVSRNVLALIRDSGMAPTVVEYLTVPYTPELLRELIAAMDVPVRDVLREKGTPYAELDLGNPIWTDDQLIAHMVAHPILVNRPIVATSLGTRLCRPIEVLLEILPQPQQAAFFKKDGEAVVDAKGRRVPPESLKAPTA